MNAELLWTFIVDLCGDASAAAAAFVFGVVIIASLWGVVFNAFRPEDGE